MSGTASRVSRRVCLESGSGLGEEEVDEGGEEGLEAGEELEGRGEEEFRLNELGLVSDKEVGSASEEEVGSVSDDVVLVLVLDEEADENSLYMPSSTSLPSGTITLLSRRFCRYCDDL